MLRIQLGENSSLKLKNCAHNISKSLAEGREVLALIPDQFSFEFDNALYSELGIKDFNRVTTLSFKRLAVSLINQYGSARGILVKSEQKLILIFLALQNVKKSKQLKIFSRQIDKPNFINDVAGIIDSLTRCGISAQMLENACENTNGTISDKLHDISLIYKAYCDELAQRELRDESSLIIEAARIADENGFFNCKDVYIDRFDSFSPDELKLLEIAIKDAHSVNISLSMPNTYKPSVSSPFSLVATTQNQLVSLAAKHNKPLKYIHTNDEVSRTAALAHVKDNLFTPRPTKFDNDGSVTVISADTVYEEADFVCAQISSLVAENGYNLNDIAIFTHDMDTYQKVLESAFERYEITPFMDMSTPASGMSLALYALSAIEAAATRNPDTDKILNFVRSPFSFLNEHEISLVEDYCIRWNINGKMWLSDFAADSDLSDFDEINTIRKKIIEPLSALNTASKSSTGKEIAKAFNKFLEDIKLAEHAKAMIEDSPLSERTENARLFKQLWNALMLCVSSVYLTAGDTKMSLKSFGELLRVILASQKISNPPQKLQSVKVCDVSRSIISTPKVVFVIGLNDGKFPTDIKKNGIFNGRDLAVLEGLGVAFETSMSTRLDTERLDCFNALCHATEKLYLTYSNADVKGRTANPSAYIKKVCAMLNTSVVSALSYPLEFYCRTPASAYYRFATSKNKSADELASVYESLLSIPEFKEKILRLSQKDEGGHILSPHISKKLFASGDIYITPSKIDVYNNCPFKYFLQYGLKLNVIKPMAIDAANRGSIMHHVFENVLLHFGEGFSDAPDEEISALVSTLLHDYFKEALGGNFGKSEKFKADYARFHGACLDILFNLREEYKASKFRPVRFEYELRQQDGKSILSIPINEGLSVCFYGVVDRVDTYTAPDGTRYIRIADYKTGSKKLDYKDIYNGLNLQMLIYMLALTEGTDTNFNSCVPAGVIYVNSGFLKCEKDYDPLSDDTVSRLEEAQKQFVRTGLIIEDLVSLEAMDSEFSGNYVPVTKNKNGSFSAKSSLISPESFKLLEEFSARKVQEFGNSLLVGKIDAIPVGKDNKNLPCRYCDFTSVCDRKKYMFKKTDEKADRENLEKLIEEVSENGN